MTSASIWYFAILIIIGKGTAEGPTLVSDGCVTCKSILTDENGLEAELTGKSIYGDDNTIELKQEAYERGAPSSIPKSARLKTPQMITSHGHECEEFDVTTEDGYILKLFHIKGNRSEDPPILLMHGVMDSSDTWLMRGKASLAINLTESGYDVWIGNIRGNKYSRRHVSLDPDVDKKFWDYDYHENGYYDNPALIDFILKATGKSQVIYVGHSQGTLNYFVTGSTRPEYNDKVKLFIALAPIFYTYHYKGIDAFGPALLLPIYTSLKACGEVELINENSTLRRTLQSICTENEAEGYELCCGFFFSLFGADPAGLEPDFFPSVMGHYFAGTSLKLLAHGIQLLSHNHGWFDYGPAENMVRYNSPVAPQYDVSKLTSKVVLMVGRNDYVGNPQDAKTLQDALPNADYFEMPYEQFNHLDFVWGRYMTENFFPYFHRFLNKYK